MTDNNATKFGELSRRDFVKYSAGTVACVYLTTLNIGCSSDTTQVVKWPISKTVYTTTEQQIFPVPISATAPKLNPKDLPLYTQYNIPFTDATSHSINAELVVQLTPAMQTVIANAGTPIM